MEKLKILKKYQGQISPIELEELDDVIENINAMDTLLFFKHKCSKKWLKKVRKKAKLKEKLTVDEVRRLLIEASKLKLEQ